MKIIGIICEYNPFHLGHQKQFDYIRAQFGSEAIIVCLMSGNFVQRGMPAVFDKSLRAKAAIDCGADMVLELPVTYSLCSAEGFAAGGVKILSSFCDDLCFGSETADATGLTETARALLSDDFSPIIRQILSTGCSFPAARQKALAQMGLDPSLLRNPNDILAVEYCKAILAQGSTLNPLPIRRSGDYHDSVPDPSDPSATAIRHCIQSGDPWEVYVPQAAWRALHDAPVHDIAAGERAILARLRTMEEADFAALPYGSEGLWRKLMHASRENGTLEEIITATKSKRYTRTRLDRMIMCAFLGIDESLLNCPPPYVRVLGLRSTGIPALKKARETGQFLHTGEKADHPYQTLERRWDDLYGLFRVDTPNTSGLTDQRRIYLRKNA